MAKIYGIWHGTSWGQTIHGDVVQSENRAAVAAQLHNIRRTLSANDKTSVREIGEDGLPVPVAEPEITEDVSDSPVDNAAQGAPSDRPEPSGDPVVTTESPAAPSAEATAKTAKAADTAAGGAVDASK